MSLPSLGKILLNSIEEKSIFRLRMKEKGYDITRVIASKAEYVWQGEELKIVYPISSFKFQDSNSYTLVSYTEFKKLTHEYVLKPKNTLPKARLDTIFDRGKYENMTVSYVMQNHPEYILWCIEHEKMYQFSQTVINECTKNYFGVSIFVGRTLTYTKCPPGWSAANNSINGRHKVTYPYVFTVKSYIVNIRKNNYSNISVKDQNNYGWSISPPGSKYCWNPTTTTLKSINNEESINDLLTTSSTQSKSTGSEESSFRCKTKPQFASANDSFNGIKAFKGRDKIQFGN
jgi:hypothetical protein